MNETLFPYYERELLFIRQLVQEFQRRFPAAAGRLLLEANRSADPHVERLLESFALFAGRVQHKLDDEFPEIATPLLQALDPHYLAPIPSMGMLQFDLDAARAQLPGGFALPRHSLVHTQPVEGMSCRFRTAYPVTLWPVQITDATLQPPPFPRGLAPPANTRAALRLHVECAGSMKFADLQLDRLRLYLDAEPQALPTLYELLCNHALQVVFRPLETVANPAPLVLAPHACLAPAGFAPDESLLPYAPASGLGYRLLTELFVFPAKFWFIDLAGWAQVRRRGWQQKCEVIIYLERSLPVLEKTIAAGTFRLGCTPVVNLFQQAAETVKLVPGQNSYRVVPDSAQPFGLEVYSLDSVRALNPADNTATECPPFFSVSHPRRSDRPETYWYTSRSPSLAEKDQGTMVDLHLVNLDFEAHVPQGSILELATTCSNRDLPNQLRLGGDAVAFELEAAAPLARIRCLGPLTPPMRPRARRGRFWHLISHLSLNALSLTGDGPGREALREILGLYDFSDPEAGQQQMAALTRQFVEGIVAVSHRRVIGRLTRANQSSFGRGLEVAIALDEEKYAGVGVYLFASVLERFLGLYVSRNSFVQLAARKAPGDVPFKVWPPRAGELPSL